MKKKNVIYQGHHPSRTRWPNFTLSLRKWVHLYIRRLEQLKPTEENLDELAKVFEAVGYIYLLKKAEYEQSKHGGDTES
jgi:hypothetical protein